MVGKKNSVKELRWRKIVDRQAASGLSVREFCASAGVSPPSFYQWRRRLGERADGTRARKSRRRDEERGEASAFIPLKLIESSGTIEVVHPLGCRVRVDGDVDSNALSKILDVLDRRGDA